VVKLLNSIRYATGPILPYHILFPTSERSPSILTGPNFGQHSGYLGRVFSQISLVLWTNCKFWDSTSLCQNRLVTHSTARIVWYRRHLKITKPITRRTSWPQHDTVQATRWMKWMNPRVDILRWESYWNVVPYKFEAVLPKLAILFLSLIKKSSAVF
jgi:hypothetical protein